MFWILAWDIDGKCYTYSFFFLGKKKENHIKKPLNAFMLYMKEMRPVVQAECTLKESAAINQILGRRVSSNWLAWFIIIAKDSGNRSTNCFSCWRKSFGSFVCLCSTSCETFLLFERGIFLVQVSFLTCVKSFEEKSLVVQTCLNFWDTVKSLLLPWGDSLNFLNILMPWMSEKTSFLRGEGGAIFTWKELSANFSLKSLLNQSFLLN